MECYLDNAATTKTSSSVIELMKKTLEEDYANPSSLHRKGFEAEKYIEEAKERIAKTLRANKNEILFTSGGTESNNHAIFGAAETKKRDGNHIVTTCIEHPSVYGPTEVLRKRGYEVSYLPVNGLGHIEEETFLKTIRKDTILLSVMLVNNEIGSIMDIEKWIILARKVNPKILVHVDAIQGYGKIAMDTRAWKADFISVSGHKIHGPKGVGFLYIRNGTRLIPLLYGGGQQKNLRSGTENVPGAAGLGLAAEEAYRDLSGLREHLFSLKERFITGIKEAFSEARVNALSEELPLSEAVRLTAPHIVSISFPGIKAEVLLHALEDRRIYVSSGSACSANHPALSGTLKGIGVKKELLDSTVRFSFSRYTTEEMIDYTLEALKDMLPILSKYRRM